jgi:hypothetical protein
VTKLDRQAEGLIRTIRWLCRAGWQRAQQHGAVWTPAVALHLLELGHTGVSPPGAPGHSSLCRRAAMACN